MKDYGESDAFKNAEVWGLDGDDIISDESPEESIDRALEYTHPDVPDQVEVISYVCRKKEQDALIRKCVDGAVEVVSGIVYEQFERELFDEDRFRSQLRVWMTPQLPVILREVARHVYGPEAIAEVLGEQA